MATMNKTHEEVENLFRDVVLQLLKLPRNTKKKVRFPYGSDVATGAAPSFKHTENVCFIFVIPDEDGYGAQFHISHQNDGAEKLTHINQHTAVYRINFACYGPDAANWAQSIYSGIITQSIREFLANNSFSLVSGTQRITRVPEAIDGKWWNRFDISAQFYQKVRLEEENSVSYIEHVSIKPITERST